MKNALNQVASIYDDPEQELWTLLRQAGTAKVDETLEKHFYKAVEKWIETMSTEYKPLENYDRYEDWGDTGKGHATDSSSGSSSASGYDNVSAYNSSVMQPDTSNSANSSTSADSMSDSTTESTHTGHIHGNIGVTTNAQMGVGEMEFRLTWGNLYDHVADLFLHDFVIPLYD